MELEFDKEIDAILRRARPNRGVLVGDDPPKKHLDADSISAFAENALPQKAKLLYMEHFADCDRCRKQLSSAILLNTAADTSPPAAASTPVVEAAIPWYVRLFKTQNLAIAMGALVLTFSGILGYLVLQNSRNTQNATVSQVTSEEEKRGGPFFGGEAATANSNAAAIPSASPASLTAANLPSANVAANSPVISANTAPGTLGRADAAPERLAAADDKNVGGREVYSRPTEAKTEGAPAPPPPAPSKSAATMDTVTVTGGERDEKKLASERQKEQPKDLELAKRKYDEDRRQRSDAPPAAAKSGPTRSGPLNTQSNQINSQTYEMQNVSRVVAGKTFSVRSGAWYDSAYSNQATINVRRGTDEFKKLDGGLRSIANTIGGTVVVMWKGKAYRIQ